MGVSPMSLPAVALAKAGGMAVPAMNVGHAPVHELPKL
jgi:hypothetical protein